MRSFQTLRAVLMQVSASAGGYAWGRALIAGDRPAWLRHLSFGLAGFSSAVLLMVGVAAECRPQGRPWPTAWACLAALSYAAFLMASEPFLRLDDDGMIACKGLLRLVPFLLAAGYLARAGAWAGALGAGLFLATSLAMIMRNGHDVWSGRGFFTGWIR